jgi:crotonobetainyl-CoA:carnitine CoA-transferase CaiB-like acyl-CoA transferase
MEGGALLSQRAILMALQSYGQRSANGQCHLWPCQDGQWIALNLSRSQDWELLPALFQHPEPLTQLPQVAKQVKQYTSEILVSQGRVLGLAIAAVSSRKFVPEYSWFNITARGPRRQQQPETLRVLDLSSLWAGPLCSHLLQQCGAQVIKVESAQRPDGARLNQHPGAGDFYQQLNRDKILHVMDFHSTADLQQLNLLIEQADIVIEGSRPRALHQLGIHGENIVAQNPGKVWVSITGYGRSEPEANWIGYGDDVAVAAGLCGWKNDKPVFIGDAIADPLTGLHGALAAYTFWQEGESVLLDINLHKVARYCATQMER